MADTIETLTEQLCDLTKRWNETDLVPGSQQKECTEIGRKLDKLGGMTAMQDAYYAAKGQNRCASIVQAYFDGIGDWRW